MISAVILAKNEEYTLSDCLESVLFCDEIIVIDDNSTDRTKEIATKYGAKIITHVLGSDFSSQRNFGLGQAKGDWVLFIDADERLSKELQKEIKEKMQQISDIVAYTIQRFDFMQGKMLTHGETGNIRFVRFAKKEVGKWSGTVHEIWNISGQVEDLQSPLLHYPHQTIQEFLQEINFYTDVRAKELYEKGIQSSYMAILCYPIMKFMQNYILKQGFLDGTEGIVFALMMSFHSFLVRAKVWQLGDKKVINEKK